MYKIKSLLVSFFAENALFIIGAVI